MQDDVVRAAKWKLIDAIYKHAEFAARFECQANNYDRPIADTPWLAGQRYGDGEYDARWYAVQSAKTHFIEGLSNAIDDDLKAYTAIVAYRSAPIPEGDEGE
jgi:hypothetical protein